MKKQHFLLITLAMLLNIAIFVYKTNHTPQPIETEHVQEAILPDEPIVPEVEEEVTEPVDEPSRVPEFVVVPKFRNIGEQSVYGDVLSHSEEAPFGDQHGRSTNAHETGHGIHSYLRQKHRIQGKRVNGFYVLEGRGVIIEEPNMRKSHINKFVPQNLRAYRFNLYLEKQVEWDDTPLYIYDEWNAYVLGGKCNVDDVENGRHKGQWSDGVSGCLEFSIYAIALCMAVKEHDPAYWESNKQFRDFTIWNLRESQKTYMAGHTMKEFKWDKQDALLKELLHSSAAEPMRKFIAENLEGVWLDTAAGDLEIEYEPHQCKELKHKPHCHCRVLLKD